MAGLDSRDVSARLSEIGVDAAGRQLVDTPSLRTQFAGCGRRAAKARS
jgi:hypothetical protein